MGGFSSFSIEDCENRKEEESAYLSKINHPPRGWGEHLSYDIGGSTMLKLIPSKDMRKHLAELGREFSDFEKATFIYNQPESSLDEREAALKTLAHSTQDERLALQINENLHDSSQRLETFIRREDGFIYLLMDTEYAENGYFASYALAKKHGLETQQPFSVAKARLISTEAQAAALRDKDSDYALVKWSYGEVFHDAGGNILSFWDDELDESPFKDISPEDRLRFELAYIDIPHPFRRGDIVRLVGSDKVGIIMEPRSEAEYQKEQERLSKLKIQGLTDYSDCSVTVNFIAADGVFYHEHIMPIYLEYGELRDDTPYKMVLECAKDLLLGECDFETFQRIAVLTFIDGITSIHL